MKRIILYTAVSVDGFIAKKDGDINWLHDTAYEMEGEDFGYGALMNRVDTTLMGANTYRQILGFDIPFPYIDTKNYVFSRTGQLNTMYAEIIREEIIPFVRNLKSGVGKDIWLIGGGQINGLLLEHELIDELILSVIPTILGTGIRLFEGTLAVKSLQLKKCNTYENGMIQQIYYPKRGEA